jgi:hypothetical protein
LNRADTVMSNRITNLQVQEDHRKRRAKRGLVELQREPLEFELSFELSFQPERTGAMAGRPH